MADTTSNNQAIAEDTTVTFYSHLYPELADGKYSIEIKQNFKCYSSDKEEQTVTKTSTFEVLGPRFSLNPDEIIMRYPPKGGNGHYHRVIPHITLKRAILPWERQLSPVSKNEPHTPWLALILITGTEMETQGISIKTGALEDIKAYNKDNLELGETLKDSVSYIEAGTTFLQQILPKIEELPLLTHIRERRSNDSSLGKHSVLMGNRLPQSKNTEGDAEENHVFLVSLETLESNDFPSEKDFLPEENSPPKEEKKNLSENRQLIILDSWQFTSCGAEDEKTFDELAKKLRYGPLALNEGKSATVNKFLNDGYIPLPHQTKHGNHLISWYRGPLTPEAPQELQIEGEVINHSDDLMGFFSEVGMLDVSYASAWNLGRNLMLKNKRVSEALFDWKRGFLQSKRSERSIHLLVSRLSPSPLPKIVSDWLIQLIQLKHIPFNYLIPTANLFKPPKVNSSENKNTEPSTSNKDIAKKPKQLDYMEYLRFFSVDPDWIKYVLNGAISIGDSSSSENAKKAREYIYHKLSSLKTPPPQCITGIVLHSEIVSTWPQVIVEATKGKETLTQLHQYHPGKNTLICFFDGKIDTISLSLPVEVLHSGVKQIGDVIFRKNHISGVIDIKKTAKAICDPDNQRLLIETSLFARRMIEGTPKISWKINSPQKGSSTLK